MADLIIVESPGKVKTISGYLGAGYKVAASVGHVRDLPENEMGVYPPDFRPQYVYTERGKEVVARLKRLVNECDTVYLAMDQDREGEAIAWHLQQSLDLTNPKRISFVEITPSALKASLAAPGTINLKKVAAQEARRVLDRQVGYMVSSVIGEALGDRSFSAGRVQSVAVRLVVDRDNEIAQHVSVTHFGAELSFGSWKATWQAKPLFQAGQEHWTDKGFAERVAGIKSVRVVSCDETESKSAPPPPFITSTLQKAASNALGMSPKKAMDVAQKLYEQGAITYMRTDSTALSNDALAAIMAYGKANNLPVLDKPRTWKAKADAQGAHEAIRPSDFNETAAGEDDDQRKLYQLIWKRAIGSQLEEARFAVRSAILEAVDPLDGLTITFLARGKKLSSPGWKVLTPQDSAEDPDAAAAQDADGSDNPVPELQADAVIQVTTGQLQQSKTNPPARYTEVTLLGDLESRGIGRPSTFAAIIENIIETRGYVEIFGKKKQLRATPRGQRLVKALQGRFKFIEYDFTRIAEEQLEAIEEGKTPYKGLISLIHGKLVTEIKEFKTSHPVAYPCPKCSRGLVLNLPKKKKDSAWWGCSGYLPDGSGCDYAAEDAEGSPGKSRAPDLTEFDCGSCGKPLIHRIKEGEGGWSFFSCSGFKDGCKQSYPDKEGQPDLASPKIKQGE